MTFVKAMEFSIFQCQMIFKLPSWGIRYTHNLNEWIRVNEGLYRAKTDLNDLKRIIKQLVQNFINQVHEQEEVGFVMKTCYIVTIKWKNWSKLE